MEDLKIVSVFTISKEKSAFFSLEFQNRYDFSQDTLSKLLLIYFRRILHDIEEHLQACNAHGLYCVPLYDTLGMLYAFPSSSYLSQ